MSDGELMRGFPPPAAAQVTLANWRQAPFSRWAFHHVREVVPSAAIPRGPRAWRLPRAVEPVERITFATPGGGETSVAAMLAETHTDGFLVLKHGQIVCERYDHGHGPGAAHIIFSISKSLTGLVAGILADRGSLDVDAPVVRYVPEADASAYGECTVQHLLDMTVSIEFEEDYLDASGAFARYRQATAWNPPADPQGSHDLRSFLVTLKRGAHPHGERYHYVSPNIDLLGWVVERAAGERLADLVSNLLWQPMGAEADAYVTVDRLGAPRAAGGMCTTLRDLARVGELMRCRGMAGGRQVVPGWWVDDVLENGSHEAWVKGERDKLMPNGSYRAHWYAIGNDHGAFCAIGIHGQRIYVDPAASVVIVRHASQPLPIDDAADHLHLVAYDAIARALAD